MWAADMHKWLMAVMVLIDVVAITVVATTCTALHPPSFHDHNPLHNNTKYRGVGLRERARAWWYTRTRQVIALLPRRHRVPVRELQTQLGR